MALGDVIIGIACLQKNYSMTKTIRIYLLLGIASTFMFISCKDNSTSSDIEGDSGIVEKIIGPDGGEVVSKDNIIKLSIPEGVLENDTAIKLTRSEQKKFRV